MLPGTATTRTLHTTAKTNAVLWDYGYTLTCIREALVHQLRRGDDTAAEGAAALFRLATERTGDELARLAEFAAAGREVRRG